MTDAYQAPGACEGRDGGPLSARVSALFYCRQEPEAPGPDNGDMRTMTDVAVPKEKVPCPGVEGETLKTDSATVCWGGHSQSLSLLQDDEPICHRQGPAKKYRYVTT